MATISPTWTEDITGTASSSVAAGASAAFEIDLDTLGADLADVTVLTRFNNAGNPDGDGEIEIFYSTDSGGQLDTEAAQTFTMELVTGSTKVKTISISHTPYARIKMNNNDSSADMTFAAWYAWRQWTSV